MVYNLTQIANNATGLSSFTVATNNVLLDGWLGVILLVVIWFVAFNAYQYVNGDPRKAFGPAFFAAFLFSLFFNVVGIVQPLATFICLFLAAASVAFNFKD